MTTVARRISDGYIIASRGKDGLDTEVMNEALSSGLANAGDVETVTMTTVEFKAAIEAQKAATPSIIAERAAKAAEDARLLALKQDAIRAQFMTWGKNKSPSEMRDWIGANVNTIADVKDHLARLTVMAFLNADLRDEAD